MPVTPAEIAVELGRTAPEPQSPEYAQWELWIADARMLISARLGDITQLDFTLVDYVVRQAVSAHVKRPDDATQVAVSVDDGSVSKTFRSARGRVEILDEWWKLLAPKTTGRAFSITPVAAGGPHMPWCSAVTYVDAQGATTYGGAYCTCGADLTNYAYPLYEGGVLSGDNDGDGY